jgi:hypothetical protein
MKIEENFIQWKGTDICMDFWCDCGTQNHYNGYFAYYVQCKGCKQVYKLDSKVMMQKSELNKDHSPLQDED